MLIIPVFVSELRYVICAVIGYRPQHFDLLINYTRRVPRTADYQLISSWDLFFKPGETSLLRARGYNPRGDYTQTKYYKYLEETKQLECDCDEDKRDEKPMVDGGGEGDDMAHSSGR